jgi:thiol-disulfide isomerase/thioredoxin
MRLVISAIVLAMSGGIVSAADFPSPANLPRYKFTVGEQLVYREDLQEVPQPGDAADQQRGSREGHWRVWVVDQNRDGSWRLVIWHQIRLLRTAPKTKPVERFANRILAYCDVFPDGRILPNDTLGDLGQFLHLVDPCALFIPLPPDTSMLAKGWSAPMPVCALPESGERVFKCSIDQGATRADGSVVINCTEHDPMHAMYDQRESRRCVFDVAKGRMFEYTRESDERGPRSSKTRSQHHMLFKLESVGRRPLPWIKQLKDESQRFFAVKSDYDRLCLACGQTRTVKDCRAQRDRARALLTANHKSAAVEPVHEQYENLLKDDDSEAKDAVHDAEFREILYSRGPADWELTAFDGSKHRLKDYRGQVVVLDFWFGSCGWCIKSYPQIKRIARKYKDRGVVVLGMNTDVGAQEATALAVMRNMDLKYTNLKAQPALPSYEDKPGKHYMGYPTVFILDQMGRISDVHVGCSSELEHGVGEAIDRLLAAQGAKQ